MSASPEHTVGQASVAAGERPGLRVLLYSDDRSIRDAVRVAVGRRPSREIAIESWFEYATPAAAQEAMRTATFDLLILDGEAAPYGGLGMCRQFKHEFFECPPIIVLTGRKQDDWLAAWSYADAAVPHPLDPVLMAKAVAETAGRVSVKPA